MTQEKLLHDAQILCQFIQFYCDKEHTHLPKKEHHLTIVFQENTLKILPYCLCFECESLLHYAYSHLKECQQDPKPSCRICQTPCYEKNMWKKMAKVMRYSGMRLGFLKLKKLFS